MYNNRIEHRKEEKTFYGELLVIITYYNKLIILVNGSVISIVK